MPRHIDVADRVVRRVEVPVQARRVVDVAEEGVLGEEASEFRIEVAGLGEVEARLSVKEVAGEAEAVQALVEFRWEAVVAPGILGPRLGPTPASTRAGSAAAAPASGAARPLGFQGAPAFRRVRRGILPRPVPWKDVS